MNIAKIPTNLISVMIYSKHEDVNAIDIDLSWSVLQFKNEIAMKFGTPALQQSLFLKVALC